jgi:hypothetical protein
VVIVIKPAIAVKAAINPDNVEPPLHKLRPENGADISVDARNQYSHSRHFCPVKKATAQIGKATLHMALHQVPWREALPGHQSAYLTLSAGLGRLFTNCRQPWHTIRPRGWQKS